MKKLLLLLLLSASCYGESQAELTDASISSVQGASVRMHYYYRLVNDKYKAQLELLGVIHLSQINWISYHHNLLKAYQRLLKGKSSSAMCENTFHVDMIKARIEELKKFLYSNEYDVCNLDKD